jgi:subtilisin family serine protease
MKRFALLAAVAAGLAPAPAQAAAGAPTGRLLVLLDRPHHGVRAVAADARLAGHSVPQIGLVTVRPRPGERLSALAARLRADPRVHSVQLERRFTLREVPNDPALTVPETAPGTPEGTVVEWWAARENLPAMWDVSHGDGAVLAVIDQGVDTSHPELTGRVKETIDLDDDPGSGPATTDENGHGTHVASLACATAGNGIGLAGVGYGCSLIVIKSNLTDSSVASAIVTATDHGADAINMSFGQDNRALSDVPESERRAIDYAYNHNVTMVAAAADQAVSEQGDPANVLQPTNTGPKSNAGKGLSVTAADFDDHRAAFGGFGTQISIAAYGTFRYQQPSGPAGLFGAFPGNEPTEIETDQPCHCRTTFQGDRRYAYLQGTSMAAPMVSAVAAVIHHANPALRASDVIAILKLTATRPAGTGWSPDLGWGIINGGAAIAAAKGLDRTRPVSRLTAPKRVHGRRSFTLRWVGSDSAAYGVPASGVSRYEVWRTIDGGTAKRIAVTTKRSLRLHGTPPRTYGFFTRAIDNAGNRESRPRRPDASTRIVRR